MTDAWIATIPATEREKSDAYFEGGYWIQAWGTLITVAIAWILLETRFSAGLRDFAERRARKPFRQTLLYAAGFMLAIGILGLPWTLYVDFLRERRGVRDIADPAGLPLAMAIFAVVMLLLAPVSNSIVRIAENQADAFGLEAAKEPQGFASVAMRLASYRKIEPGQVEECVFYDHPSGRTRVMRSMRWLAEHPPQLP